MEPLPAVPAGVPAASTAPAAAWADAAALVQGVCFEAAYDAAGRVFSLRRPEDLAQFYDQVDHSQLCRQPISRAGFDFAGGTILAGLWSRGAGCTAHHEILGVDRSESDRALRIRLRLVTQGDCAYELVQPFWIALPGYSDWQIEIAVE